MPRPCNPDLIARWNVSLPATLAGAIEFHLYDPIHNKPLYGAKSKLIETLLQEWLDKQQRPSHANG
jgi:hypothetical protein